MYVEPKPLRDKNLPKQKNFGVTPTVSWRRRAGEFWLAVAPLGIYSTVQLVTAWPQTLALASTANRRGDVGQLGLRRGAEDIRRTFRPVTVPHTITVSLSLLFSLQKAPLPRVPRQMHDSEKERELHRERQRRLRAPQGKRATTIGPRLKI